MEPETCIVETEDQKRVRIMLEKIQQKPWLAMMLLGGLQVPISFSVPGSEPGKLGDVGVFCVPVAVIREWCANSWSMKVTPMYEGQDLIGGPKAGEVVALRVMLARAGYEQAADSQLGAPPMNMPKVKLT
jgi:hypothetical protein